MPQNADVGIRVFGAFWFVMLYYFKNICEWTDETVYYG